MVRSCDGWLGVRACRVLEVLPRAGNRVGEARKFDGLVV
jgi:hypothetical protein